MVYDAIKATFQDGQKTENERFNFENRDLNQNKEEEIRPVIKTKAGAGIYGSYNPENSEEILDNSESVEGDKETIDNPELEKNNLEENNETEKQDLLIIKDSPYFPILKGLSDQGHLDLETYNAKIEALGSSSNDEEQKIILEKTVEGIKSMDKKQKTLIIEGFKGVENVTEDNFEKSKFYFDFQNPETGAKPKGSDLDLLLAENYTKIPNVDGGDTNKKNDLNVTMNIVSNKIIKNHSKDFRKNNSELINDIRNIQNIGEKYTKLNKLLKESKSEDAKKGTNQSIAYKKGKEKKEEIIISIENRFEQFKKDYEKAKVNNDKEILKEIQEEGEELKNDTEVSGEVFEGLPELEEILSNIEDILTEQA